MRMSIPYPYFEILLSNPNNDLDPEECTKHQSRDNLYEDDEQQ